MAYQSLSSITGYMRLLHLLPSVNMDGDIQCELVHRNLDEEAPYSALSYVWGNPEPAKAITLGEQTAYVTPNLFAALRRLRHATEMTYLWVDALCINQDDDQERSSQVEQMWKIYQNAEIVLMWLGEEGDDSNLAMELVQLLHETVSNGDRIVPPDDEPDRLDRFRDIFCNTSFDQHWSALGHLFKRPYWSRVWIVQEVLFAPKAILCCGALKANWMTFTLCLYLLSQSPFSNLSSAASKTLSDPTNLPITLATMHTRRMVGEEMSFLEGLVFYRHRLATDPKDHIYAILNLVEQCDVKPDYSKSLFTLYTEVAKFTIEKYESLDIFSACKKAHLRTFNLHTALLSLVETLGGGIEAAMSEDWKVQSSGEIEEYSDMSVERPSNHSLGLRDSHLNLEQRTRGISNLENIHKSLQERYLPSWVPDWRDTVPESGYLLLNYSDHCYYETSGTTKPKVHFPEDQQLLIADAIRVDSIKAVSSKITGSESVSLAIKDGWDLWRLGDHPTHRYGDQKQQQDAFRQTIVVGSNLDGSKGNRHLSAHAANAMFELDFIDEGKQEDEERPNDREYMSIHLMNPWLGFCITNQGFMGRTPHGTIPGDVIVVFLGAKVPFVLRKHHNEDKYFILGECYIHGIMEGEVPNELEKGERDIEKFCLL